MRNEPAVLIRELQVEDEKNFLAAMQASQALHQPWVRAPLTSPEFGDYVQRFRQNNHKSYLVCNQSGGIAGVYNISEIVRGAFQSAYLGFYAVADYAGQGYMSAGLKLVLQKIFRELNLHRIEANIQPENTGSISLVKKNGFRYEGFSPRYLKMNNEWRGHEHWAMTLEDFIMNDEDIQRKDKVDLVAYNPEWPKLANLEIDRLRSIFFPFNKMIDIQHVGSTAIPGLSAKPILDIQIAVNSLAEIKELAIPALQKLGYEYWAENPDITRLFFAKGMPPFGAQRTHHVHIVEFDSDHWRNKILFRDYLLLHPEMAKEYEQLKILLAKKHIYDREKYTDEKREFVNKILKLAQKK